MWLSLGEKGRRGEGQKIVPSLRTITLFAYRKKRSERGGGEGGQRDVEVGRT